MSDYLISTEPATGAEGQRRNAALHEWEMVGPKIPACLGVGLGNDPLPARGGGATKFGFQVGLARTDQF